MSKSKPKLTLVVRSFPNWKWRRCYLNHPQAGLLMCGDILPGRLDELLEMLGGIVTVTHEASPIDPTTEAIEALFADDGNDKVTD